jgi:hypothetical protein
VLQGQIIPAPSPTTLATPTTPSAACADPVQSSTSGTAASPSPPRSKHEQFKAAWREKIANHRVEPDGVPTPIGVGNFWTEFKYVFGSGRQFWGTDEATEGIWHHAKQPPAPFERFRPYQVP